MPKPDGKYVRESSTEQIQIIMPAHINGDGRLFGGQLVQWIDVVGGVVARRHSGRNVTTASIEKLKFKAPAFVNDTVVLVGNLVYVGTTSMDIRVDTYVESFNGDKYLTNTAYLTFVALDDNQKPIPVPKLIIETDEQKKEWNAAELRRKSS